MASVISFLFPVPADIQLSIGVLQGGLNPINPLRPQSGKRIFHLVSPGAFIKAMVKTAFSEPNNNPVKRGDGLLAVYALKMGTVFVNGSVTYQRRAGHVTTLRSGLF
jgi:hypothetical protein